jgi:hypothetical protein
MGKKISLKYYKIVLIKIITAYNIIPLCCDIMTKDYDKDKV